MAQKACLCIEPLAHTCPETPERRRTGPVVLPDPEIFSTDDPEILFLLDPEMPALLDPEASEPWGGDGRGDAEPVMDPMTFEGERKDRRR